jgi:hypothetical protein
MSDRTQYTSIKCSVGTDSRITGLTIDCNNYDRMTSTIDRHSRMAKSAQRAKNVHLHFKPLLRQAFSNSTE